MSASNPGNPFWRQTAKNAAPGQIQLIPCDPRLNLTAAVRALTACLQPRLNPTRRCRRDSLFFDIQGSAMVSEERSFSDLKHLCAALLLAAGFSASFDGLLLLDLRSLDGEAVKCERKLLALGEGLSLWMKKGFTVAFTPASPALTCPILDAFEPFLPVRCEDPAALQQGRIPPEGLIRAEKSLQREAAELLLSLLKGCEPEQAEAVLKELKTGRREVTAEAVEAARRNPYSRLSRVIRQQADRPGRGRMIGFDAGRRAG